MSTASSIAAPGPAQPSPSAGRPEAGTSPAAAFDQQRRLTPRLWDTDWLVLRGMRAAIEAIIGQAVMPGRIALDFGCGDKPYAPLFTNRGVTYVGADLGPVTPSAGHEVEIRPDGTIATGDRSADLVVSFQVLEHVRDLDTYLAEAGRVLRDDGLMLLSTHGTWLYHPHPEDHRRWTREGLIGDLERRGFEVTECLPVIGPLAWTTMVRLTCLAVALRKVPLIGTRLAAMAAVVMNLKALVEERVTPAWVTRDNACVYVTLSRPRRPARS